MDPRIQWIAESVCQSLGVDQEAFHALLEDEEASNLLSAFLSGEGVCGFHLYKLINWRLSVLQAGKHRVQQMKEP